MSITSTFDHIKLYPLYDDLETLEEHTHTLNPLYIAMNIDNNIPQISNEKNTYEFETESTTTVDTVENYNNNDIEYLSKYEYTYAEQTEIKIYNGILIETKENIIENIKFYSGLHEGNLFDVITSSTLTAKGMIGNIDFKDESIIKKMSLPRNQKIVKIGCNEEEIYIYPNEYVDYNIAHIMDIIKHSFDSKFNTRIECNCKNLLCHRDYLMKEYKTIKEQINIIKTGDIVKRIEKYLLTRKQRNKILLDKLIKIYKKLLLYIFHPYLYDDINILAMNELFKQLEKNTLFERDEHIRISKELFKNVEQFVKFFKNYIADCKCISQPHQWDKKIQIKFNTHDAKTNKSKEKIKSLKYPKRKTRGCGKYFSSQITFEIYGSDSNKIYKIKIFRNGNFQAPGVRNSRMLDIIAPLTLLSEYLSEQFNRNVYVMHIIPVMRNYMSHVIAPKSNSELCRKFKMHIFLDKLEEVCRLEKSMELIPIRDMVQIYNSIVMVLSRNIAFNILKYLPYATIKFSEITNNLERYSGILLKFSRPIPEKPNKKITIKILCNGKLSFDGCNSEIEVLELYNWLQYLFKKYWNYIVFDPTKAVNCGYVSADSEDGYESIYDDDETIVERIKCAQQYRYDPNDIANIIENMKQVQSM